ncbi:unnamed protein product [Leuciscus chuanchicus]
MQIYTGKPPGMPREINLGRRVVLDMVDGYKGHIVTCDNFFSSYALGTELLKRKIRMIGTIRKNKTELPSALVSTRGRATHSSLFAFTETHTIVSYIPKKNSNVLLMSTVHSDAALSERDDQKPQMILSYNSTKGGVDNLDKIVATYTCRRKTARWPMAVFYNIVDVSAYNSFVIWREVNPSWRQADSFKRRHFLEELGRALLVPPHLVPPELVPSHLVPPHLVPPHLVPPHLVPPELVPPELVPSHLVPPHLVPPELVPPQLVHPELVPPHLVPPELVPPQLVHPELVPPHLVPPDLVPPQLVHPELVPPHLVPPEPKDGDANGAFHRK